jgi:YegS/Rv2252/BmrU family lipid kinase
MNKIALFYNPVAGGGTFGSKLDDIVAFMQAEGMQVIPWRINNNQQLLSEMANMDLKGFHTIIAAGGDGTVHGVVNAMKKLDINVPLGIFPIGTANDTARNLQIPSELKGYCKVITHGQTKAIDLGKIEDHYFINVASAGFMIDVAHKVTPKYKNVLGKGAYYLMGAMKFPEIKPFPIKFTVDGEAFQCNAYLFLLLNGKGAGGITEILPNATMDDGLLDIMIIKDGSPVQLLSTLKRKLTGEQLDDSVVIHVQGKQFILETEITIETDLDGEAGPDMPWKVEVIKAGIEVRTPF